LWYKGWYWRFGGFLPRGILLLIPLIPVTTVPVLYSTSALHEMPIPIPMPHPYSTIPDASSRDQHVHLHMLIGVLAERWLAFDPKDMRNTNTCLTPIPFFMGMRD
jgi:hypothetical protein